MIRRASGRTSANVGRSPKPSKWASIGTRGAAHRVAALAPDRDQREVARCSVISRATNRTVFVLSGPARPPVRRDQDDQALAALALGKQRMVLATEHGGEVGQDLVDLLGCTAALRASRPGRA